MAAESRSRTVVPGSVHLSKSGDGQFQSVTARDGNVIIIRKSAAMIKLLVIADDLTGSIDTGVQFAQQGIATLVTVDRELKLNHLAPDLQVLVVDAESRHLSPDDAARRVRKIAESARKQDVKYFYKKTDSTLRGNVGAELDAVITASGCDALSFIPAFPKTSRYTRNGFQFIGDKLLHQTQYGSDPLDPVKSSFIPEILGSQTRRKVVTANLNVTGKNREETSRDAEIFLFDCESETDLLEIGEALRARKMLNLTAGSAAFAGMLPELLQLPRTDQDFPRPKGPLLIINGSLNEVSLKQATYAAQKGVKTFDLTPEILTGSPFETAGYNKVLLFNLARESSAGHDVIIRTAADRSQLDDLFKGNYQDKDIRNTCLQVSAHLGKIVFDILQKSFFNTVTIFGGDTLIGILKALSIIGVRPMKEIYPGIVVSRMEGATRSLSLISKAGGFGEEDAIMRIIEYAKGETR